MTTRLHLSLALGLILCLVALALGHAPVPHTGPNHLNDTLSVWEIFERLGKIKLHKVDSSVQGFSIERGRELVTLGYTTDPQGRKTSRQSKYFVCTACHSTQRETQKLTSLDPQDRLDYAIANDLPFLPASTFYGIVNRISFYNGDYQKKYAEVPDIKMAHRDIRKAIHVCATQCAQGRPLEDWEMESILAYFWTLQIRIGDLDITDTERKKIEYALNESRSTARAVALIESHYPDQYPARFAESMPYRTLQYDFSMKEKRMANGQAIYNRSCKHCHAEKRYSFYALDDSRATFRQLDKRLQTGHPHSIYKIVRTGTYPKKGQKSYMPQYTLEKMSDVQLEDLRIFIQEKAK